MPDGGVREMKESTDTGGRVSGEVDDQYTKQLGLKIRDQEKGKKTEMYACVDMKERMESYIGIQNNGTRAGKRVQGKECFWTAIVVEVKFRSRSVNESKESNFDIEKGAHEDMQGIL
eukprot:Gb_03641 [translate_table: standard]